MNMTPFNGGISHTVYKFIHAPFLDALVHHSVQRSPQVVCGTEMCEIHSEQPSLNLDLIPPVTIKHLQVLYVHTLK